MECLHPIIKIFTCNNYWTRWLYGFVKPSFIPLPRQHFCTCLKCTRQRFSKYLYSICRISHDLRRFLIFIQLGVCFLSLSFKEVTENNELEKSYTIANHLSSYYHMFYHVFCQTTNSTFSVNIVVVSRTTHFLQDQELETKIKTKRIKLYKQTFHFFFYNF